MRHRIHTRPARGAPRPLALVDDPAEIARFVEDAAHYPGGHAAGVALPESEADVAAWLATGEPLLPVAAQSSLTGGATPFGEIVLSVSRLNRIVDLADSHVTAQAGVPLVALQETLAAREVWFPPVPTFLGACVGGVIATNAAGAATFKYGPTRHWVQAATIVLPGGEVLDLVRGETHADDEGVFEIVTASRGPIRLQAPRYTMPQVPKCTAGYYAAPAMDLLDLFIGSEGTLGVVVEATLTVAARPDAQCLALVPVPTEAEAIALVGRLRDAARSDMDVAAIEHLDARCLQILREDGALAKHHVSVPDDTAVVLLVLIELTPGRDAGPTAWQQIAGALDADAPDTALVRFCRLLDASNLLDHTEIALPGDRRREAQWLAIREAVPAGVNQRVGTARRTIDAAITKTAADMIVPFHQFGDMMAECRRLFESRGLDLAVWGHISDGNVHPNVIPRSREDVDRGRAAIMDLGRTVIALGGSPLAEHGVGRNPVKQRLARLLVGDRAWEDMRAIKRALDPAGQLAPGVLFPR
jgi:D-lactate dehydrogenase (cytochrome)